MIHDPEDMVPVNEVDEDEMTDDDWEAMFGLCDPLDHYGE